MTMTTLRNITAVALLVSALLISACNRNKVPEGIIKEKTMIELLTEMHTADAYFNNITGYECDTMIGEINYTYNQIFKKHGTTKEEFERSMDYYSQNPKKFREMYEKVVLKLNKK